MIERVQHCWVTDSQVWGDRRSPGILLGWHQRDGQWWGWVIWAHEGITARGDGPYVKHEWLPAERIEPVGGDT